MQTGKNFPSHGLIVGCALIAAAFGFMRFAAVETPISAGQPAVPQCAGFEELTAAPADVPGFRELAAPDCD